MVLGHYFCREYSQHKILYNEITWFENNDVRDDNYTLRLRTDH
jgi:hypothetical protein